MVLPFRLSQPIHLYQTRLASLADSTAWMGGFESRRHYSFSLSPYQTTCHDSHEPVPGYTNRSPIKTHHVFKRASWHTHSYFPNATFREGLMRNWFMFHHQSFHTRPWPNYVTVLLLYSVIHLSPFDQNKCCSVLISGN